MIIATSDGFPWDIAENHCAEVRREAFKTEKGY